MKWTRRDNASKPVRAARMFRYHVHTASNPRGRIFRLPYAFCGFDGDQLTESEAHHIDYDRPFVIVWVCYKHHRAIERGEIKVTKTRVCDYTSLVAPLLKPGLRAENRARPKLRIVDTPF